jgi:beta-galactosidase
VFITIAMSAPLAFADNRWVNRFQIGEHGFLLGDKPIEIRCGEVHAARVPREYWRHRLRLARAMGLNTVCAYLFWNVHEPTEGHFVWEGQADLAEYCRIAQEEGLWVLLRPGPYVCAEWEMGGLPWWLVKDDDIKLRSRDPRFMAAARRYLLETGRVLAPLQVTRGGPILMVQVENEYGFFGKDAQYMSELRQALVDAGFDVPLFACNPIQHLRDGFDEKLFPVVNFGSDPAGAFEALRRVRATGPLMCGEFYPGWFDTWGAPHHAGKTDRYLADLEYMLRHDASFSIYMAHGGTTFGLYSGADRPFKPDTSSYDYDAPISEAGWTTEKFDRTRALFQKFLPVGEKLPDPPARNPAICFEPVAPTGFASLAANLPPAIADERPRTMEHYDQGYGCILYRTKLAAGPAATLDVAGVHDFGFVSIDGQRVGVLDRRSRNFKLKLPARETATTLDALVEAMGRVNFGQEVHDRKGLYPPVRLVAADREPTELTGWEIYRFPLDQNMLAALRFEPPKSGTSSPAVWRFSVTLKQQGDTFLDMRPWGKGVAWMNGHCLGRYWNIGPTQTMYVPGPWLKQGENEFLVLDLLGPSQSPRLAGLDHPILDELHPELDFAAAATKRPKVTLKLEGTQPIFSGQFQPGGDAQTIRFATPRAGRYVCIESLSAFDGKPFAAIADIDLLDHAGGILSHEGWTIAYVDSEERAREDGSAENAIDGQTATFWHTQWGDAQPPHPHRLVLDLGKSIEISGTKYVPRQGPADVAGRTKDVRIYVGDRLIER